MKLYYLSILAVLLFASCSTSTEKKTINPAPGNNADSAKQEPGADAVTILSKKQVPVLCYHHIGNQISSYEVRPSAFAEQMKALSDSGYKTISPDDLYEYLVHNGTLPPKPLMITFDDTDKEQFTIGEAEMKKYGFKGVYFIMTISINRKRYMSSEQLKQLSDEGHVIAAHTWDHHMVTKYQQADWDTQFVKPQRQLEAITGKPVKYFAYPFGLWDTTAITELKDRGYKLAFILSGKRDSTQPLYTVRRMIVPGEWSTQGMIKAMKTTFRL